MSRYPNDMIMISAGQGGIQEGIFETDSIEEVSVVGRNGSCHSKCVVSRNRVRYRSYLRKKLQGVRQVDGSQVDAEEANLGGLDGLSRVGEGGDVGGVRRGRPERGKVELALRRWWWGWGR